jgi:hypothetical protein
VLKPSMAESKGPIAEAAVTPAPVDQVQRPGSLDDLLGPLSSRFVAAVIDALFIGFVLLPLLLLTSSEVLNGRMPLYTVGFLASFAIVLIAYHTVLEWARGVTLGKWLLQVAVVGRISNR